MDSNHRVGYPVYGRAHKDSENDLLYRLASLELDLQEHYGVPVYCTTGLMLDRHRLTTDYIASERAR